MRRIIFLLTFLAMNASADPLAGPPAKTAGGITEPGVRKSAVLVGVSGWRHSLKGDDNELIGSAGDLQLGTGYIDENWYASLSLDILLGPYEPIRSNQLNIDFTGTGFTAWAGFSAQTLNLRSPEGGYGFALGLSYLDIVGRSIGKNRRNRPEDNGLDQIDKYIMRVNSLALMPALFFSWLAQPRPRGNTPELLATRLDGYFLTIGGALPLSSHYNVRFQTRPQAPDSQLPLRTQAKTESQKGSLAGYSIVISFTAMLGT